MQNRIPVGILNNWKRSISVESIQVCVFVGGWEDDLFRHMGEMSVSISPGP